MFPETKSRETSGLERKKTTGNWFPKGPDSKCFVMFLDFHFNSNKRITGASQNSRLGTYNKVLSLYYLHLLPPLAAVSLLGQL